MKLLIVSDAWQPQVNGVVRTYEHLSEEMRKRGHEVHVIGPNSFINFPMPGYSEIRLAMVPYRKLRKMIGQIKPDRIHISVEGPLGQAARLYCKRRKIPFSTSYHTHFPDYVAKRVGWLPKRLRRYVRSMAIAFVRRFHKKSSVMFVATDSLEEELRDWGFQTPSARLVRGARLEQFYPDEPNLFQDLQRPIQLYVGRVAVEKNIEGFLKLDTPGTKVIVGDGPEREKLEKEYPDVVFAGKKTGKDLGDHYRSADVFVFPSLTDTFGMVLIEAMACGLPIAAFDVTGPKDIVKHSYMGALAPYDKETGETGDLAKAVEQALALPPEAKDQRIAKIHEKYTWEAVGDVFEKNILALEWPKPSEKRYLPRFMRRKKKTSA